MKHFELAFKMFDINGDGEVEFQEFDTVQSVLLNATAMGSRHRDHVINGTESCDCHVNYSRLL